VLEEIEGARAVDGAVRDFGEAAGIGQEELDVADACLRRAPARELDRQGLAVEPDDLSDFRGEEERCVAARAAESRSVIPGRGRTSSSRFSSRSSIFGKDR